MEFTPADRRDVHEEMCRNALNFQKPRLFHYSGKVRAIAEQRTPHLVGPAPAALVRLLSRAMNGMRRRRLRKRLAPARRTPRNAQRMRGEGFDATRTNAGCGARCAASVASRGHSRRRSVLSEITHR